MKKSVIIFAIILVLIISIVLIINIANHISHLDTYKELEEEYQSYINGINNPGLAIDGLTPSRVKYDNIFFITEQCVKKYIEYVCENNAEAVYAILDYKYINEKSITKENMSQFIKIYSNSNINKTLDMYEIAGRNYSTYYTKHRLGSDILYFIVNIDFSTNSFSVVPIESTEYEQKITEPAKAFGNQEDSVKQNDYNAIINTYYNQEDIVQKYFQDYLNMALDDTKTAYELLDANYRDKKFGNLTEYEKYINDNRTMLELMCKAKRKNYTDFENYQKYEEYYIQVSKNDLSKYKVKQNDNETRYICIDTNGKYYIFRETAPMQYTVILDTYTIDIPEFTSQYEEADEPRKVLINIQRVFDAVKDGDYRYMYQKLDPTFRQNNFKTEEDFEKYMKKNFFVDNAFASNNVEKQGDIYIYDLTISDKTKNDARTFTKTFVVQLKEGTDFVMSFSV